MIYLGQRSNRSHVRYSTPERPPLRAPPPMLGASPQLLGAGPLSVGLGLTPERHQQGREELIEGFRISQGEDYQPTLEELQTFGGIASLESSYGRGWSGPMSGSNNWGAITCGKSPDASGACPDGCSPNKDSSPYSGEYVTCFRRWGTPAEGAAGLISFIYKWPEVKAAIQSGNLDEVSWTMRQRSYYLGFKPDPRDAAREHAGALERYVGEITAALGEEPMARRKGEDWQPGEDDALGGLVSSVGGDDAPLVALGVATAGLAVAWKLGLLDAAMAWIRRWRKRR